MLRKYILDDNHNPVPCEDVIEWGRWFEKSQQRVVKQTYIGPLWKYILSFFGISKWQPTLVSTVFLGLNHNFSEGEPLLFETMVFGGKLDDAQVRYSTWEEALEGHKIMVRKVKEYEK